METEEEPARRSAADVASAAAATARLQRKRGEYRMGCVARDNVRYVDK